jgi:hypothetical protein
MKDIPVEDLRDICPEIHDAAVRVGCVEVSISSNIWPGGRLTGPPQEAARFIDFSWYRAAAIDRRAIFQDSDPKAFAALLHRYGLGDEPAAEDPSTPRKIEPIDPSKSSANPSPRTQITVEILEATKQELERQAKLEGISVGHYLNWKFQPRPRA